MEARTPSSARVLWAAFGGLFLFAAFLLLRPFADPDPYRPRPPGTTYAYSFLVVAAFLPYAAAAWAVTRRGISLRAALWGAALLHLMLLPAALSQSQDMAAYLFYGKMWAVLDGNPYADLPIRFAGDPWLDWMRWRHQPSVYGPLWTFLSGGVARLSAGSFATAFALMKVATGILAALACWGLVRAARSGPVEPATAVVLATWNPLVLVAVPLSAHTEAAVAACLLWAVVTDRRGRPVATTLLLAAAALVKVYAGLVLLVYLLALVRRRGPALRAAAAAAAMTALALAPVWRGSDTFRGLAQVRGLASSSLGGQIQTLVAALTSESVAVWLVTLAGAAVLIVVIVLGAARPGFAGDPWPAAVAAFVAFLLVTPWLLPWYVVGVLPLALVTASPGLRAAVVTFSGTSMLTVSGGGTVLGRLVQTLLRYGIPLTAWWRWRARDEVRRLP